MSSCRIVAESDYDQEIPQSHTTDQPTAHGTGRKSHITFIVTVHLKSNNSKATSFLFLFKMIAKLEWTQSQAFKLALFFLFFPTFLICSYFSLFFHVNALLSQLFHSQMSFMRKNPEFFSSLARFL